MRYRCERVIQLDVGGQRGLWWCCDLLTCRLAGMNIRSTQWSGRGTELMSPSLDSFRHETPKVSVRARLPVQTPSGSSTELGLMPEVASEVVSAQ